MATANGWEITERDARRLARHLHRALRCPMPAVAVIMESFTPADFAQLMTFLRMVKERARNVV